MVTVTTTIRKLSKPRLPSLTRETPAYLPAAPQGGHHHFHHRGLGDHPALEALLQPPGLAPLMPHAVQDVQVEALAAALGDRHGWARAEAAPLTPPRPPRARDPRPGLPWRPTGLAGRGGDGGGAGGGGGGRGPGVDEVLRWGAGAASPGPPGGSPHVRVPHVRGRRKGPSGTGQPSTPVLLADLPAYVHMDGSDLPFATILRSFEDT